MGDGPLLEGDRDGLPLAGDRRHQDHDLVGRDRLSGNQALDVGGDRLGLRAVGRAAPELDLAARLCGGRRDADRCAPGRQDALPAADAPLQADDSWPVPLECSDPGLPGSAETAQSLARIACRRPFSAPHFERQPRRRQIEFLDIVDQEMVEAATTAATLRGEPQRAEDDVTGIERARLREHLLMGAIDLGELSLQRRGGAIRMVPRPARERFDADQLGLELIDSADEAAEQRVGAAAKIMVLERELVDPVEQHRQAIARPQHRVECLCPRCSQHQRGELDASDDEQLLVTLLEASLEAFPQRIRPRSRRNQQREPFGGASRLHEPPETGLDHGRLAGARRTHDEQRSASKCDRFALSGKQLRIESYAHSDSIGLR